VKDPRRRVGPFVLTEQIGGGRGTALYRGIRDESNRTPREVAIRAALNTSDVAAVDRVVREYEVLRVLDSPRIPKVYGYYEDAAALATSYCEGINLADVLIATKRGWVELDVATALDIAIEAAHGLRHAHSIRYGGGSRIVHGHLGPQRIRLGMNGRVTVVGFGIDARGRHPAYTPPEVANGGVASRLSDQWSLGATLIEMLTGERLYTAQRDTDEAARRGDVSRWVRQVERQQPEVGATVRTMTATDPSARFRSQPEMLKALLAAARRLGGTVHRRYLVANVLIHGDEVAAMRPDRPPVLSLPREHYRDEPAVAIPPRPISATTPEPIPQPPIPPIALNLDAVMPNDIDRELDPIPDGELPAVDIPIDNGTDTLFDSPPADAPPPEHTATNYAEAETVPLPPKSPTPTAAFLPSEIAGFVLGALLMVLGIWYSLTML
jgi:hypothetical protein